jgi:hypothetical protein
MMWNTGPMSRRSLILGLVATPAATAAAVPLFWVPLPQRRCGWGWPIDDDGQTEEDGVHTVILAAEPLPRDCPMGEIYGWCRI